MNRAHRYMQNIPGLQFYKLMGSGKGKGFNPFPDWSTYALLTVWDERAFAQSFCQSSEVINLYKTKAQQVVEYYLSSIKSHGLWSGTNPFHATEIKIDENKSIAVITRATIKMSMLYKFWRYVPTASRAIDNQADLLYTKGIGEVPIIQMATFSEWKNMQAIKDYAYNSAAHRTAIDMTRKLDWYKEELFARFVVDDKFVY